MAYKCPLCSSDNTEFYYTQEQFQRDFYRCDQCHLIFVDRNQLLSHKVEKDRYSHHQNHIRSEGYEKFLRRLIDPVVDRFSKSAQGLDYGCGPYPMAAEIFKDEGFHSITSYDPLFAPDQGAILGLYDFILLSEVIEHFNHPAVECRTLVNLLRPGGLLLISTGIVDLVKDDFNNWHYIKDDTHINFFSWSSFDYLANEFNFDIVEKGENLIILLKK